MKIENIKFENIGLELSKADFNENKIQLGMNVDSTALYQTNATKYFREAMIGENSSRSKFRQVLGVKDRVKLGKASFVSLIKPGECDFDPSDSDISQKTFEVCPLMVGTSVCVEDLEIAFMSDQLKKGSNDFSDSFEFMNYFYETLSKTTEQELEYLTFRGNTAGGGTGSTAYLTACNGLEIKLTSDNDVQKAATASAITSSNIIAKLIEARDSLGTGVKNKSDFVYMLSTNAIEAYRDAVSENKASGQYFVEGVTLNFQGTEVYHAEGASDNVIIAGNWDNFLNIQDLTSDETGFQVVDFYKTRLDRKIGVRTDFKFSPDYVVSEEIFIHKPA